MTSKPDDNPANLLEQIRKLTRDFGKQISQGKSPRIQKFLSQISEEGHADLFFNLLGIETNYRRSKGESPTSDEYVRRFPQFKKQVRRAFFEPTMGSVDSSASTDGDDQTASLRSPNQVSDAFAPTYELPDANRLGDYELIRKLGQGGMGIVYEARHTKTNNRVALKTLLTGGDGQQINADKLYRFRKEFRRLSEINHPNLVGMQSLEVDGDRWFFTMDLIDGEDFLSYVRPDDQLDQERLRSSLKQLATGVLELHRRGIIHRDLKPSNVLVSPEGRVTILDFGLAAQLQRNADMTQTKSGMFAGTPPYAAPEQMFGERTEASDWYAFGTMLFEALAGERPFQDPDPMKLLRLKQEQDPPQLAERDGVPSDLSALADGLLRREPGLRLLSDAIGTTLGLEEETRIPGSTRGSQGSEGSADAEDAELDEFQEEEIVLIGRDEQVAELEEIKREFLETRQPQVVWITGLSGEGKSTLAEQFLRPIRKEKWMLVLSGRCYDRESVPFKAIDSFLEPLVRWLLKRPSAEVDALLPTDIEMLAYLFPLLRQVSSINERCKVGASGFNELQIRNLAFAALRDLLESISRKAPVVIMIDDLQWGDADSAAAILKLISPPSPPAILFLASCRSDEIQDSPFLNQWKRSVAGSDTSLQASTVEVKPLTEAECQAFLQPYIGDHFDIDSKSFSELYQATKGNPYFLKQIVEGYDPQTRKFRPVPLQELIHFRLGKCPAGARRLLEIIAVAGKSVSANEVSIVAGQPANALATITHMRSEKLLRLVGDQDSILVDTYHDKIRETVIEFIEEPRRRQLHLEYAESIEQAVVTGAKDVGSTYGDRVFDLAHHFNEAGDARANRFLLMAGKSSLEAFAMENAIDYFSRAEQTAPDELTPVEQFDLLFGRARALAGLHQTQEAIRSFEAALEKAVSEVSTARCYFAMGECSWKQADYESGLRNVRQALTSLGERLPRSTVAKLLRGTWALSRFTLATYWGKPRRQRAGNDEQMVLLSQMYALWTHMVLHKDVASVIFAASTSCLRARRVKGSVIRVEAYSTLASILAFSGLSLLGRRILRQADREGSEGSRAQSGIEEYNRSIYALATAALVQSEELACLAAHRMERTRDWRGAMAHHAAWHAEAWLGKFAGVFAHAKREEQIARLTSDEITIAYAYYGQAEALACQGRIDLAKELADIALTTITRHKATFVPLAMIQKGKVLLQQGQFDEARSLLSQAIAQLPKLRLYAITVCALPCFVEAVVKWKWFDQEARMSLGDRSKAGCCAFLGRMLGRLFPGTLPYSYRMSGRLALALRKDKKARKYFDRAIALAEKIEAKYEYARSLIDRSQIDDPAAKADRELGIQLLESLGCVLPEGEIKHLCIDRKAHHARAAAARAKFESELDT